MKELDYFAAPFEEIVLHQQEQITDAESRARRWDEGVMMMEWNLAKLPAQNSAVLTPQIVLGLLGAISVYSQTGAKAPWMKRVCMDMGWTP